MNIKTAVGLKTAILFKRPYGRPGPLAGFAIRGAGVITEFV
ncbi:MAG: hypothetical protein OXE84_11390 [Rhodobacteraceae bacterium]|nr:hypothetical protein [Paracoccaceae bacterium]MCY4196228.1 hypothetical protein [Paracoccaceae bacterium]